MIASSGLTLAAKILGAKAGAPVAPGDCVDVSPDITLSGGDTAAVIRALAARESGRVIDPEMHVVVLDHCRGEAETADEQMIRSFVESQGIDHFYDVDAGLAHQVAAEQGFALPGRLILGCDSRAVTCGAFGTYTTTIGPDDMAAVMAGRQVRLRVPETVRLVADGSWPAAVGPADLALRLLAELGNAARGCALELDGPAVAALGMAGRMALCDLAAESGAISSYVEPDARTLAWLNGRARDNFDLVHSDDDARYGRSVALDVGRLDPQIAGTRPGDQPVPVSRLMGMPVDQVVIGGGASGRLPDLHAAAAVLRDRRVSGKTRLLVLPASAGVLKAAAGDGTLLTLLEAGATLLNPGCGTCMDRLRVAPARGETILSAADFGLDCRTPSVDAAVYRASVLTCAASALAGRITDARDAMSEAALRAAAAAAAEN